MMKRSRCEEGEKSYYKKAVADATAFFRYGKSEW
jgi:hypothetical protein